MRTAFWVRRHLRGNMSVIKWVQGVGATYVPVLMLAVVPVLGQSSAVAQPAALKPAEQAKPAKPAKPRPARKGKQPAIDLALHVAALASVDVEAAAKAAEALGTSDQPIAHDALLDALAVGMPKTVAVPAIAALARHPAPSDVPALARYAGHHDQGVRGAALAALAVYPDPIARAAVIGGLHDPALAVRAAAAAAAGRGRIRDAVEPLFKLMARGEESAALGLAAMADADLAAKLADQLGKVPDATLAVALGAILKRSDFGPDPARVEIVRAIAKIQDPAALGALIDYLDSTPKTPPRPSRQEAQTVVEARLGGGKQ